MIGMPDRNKNPVTWREGARVPHLALFCVELCTSDHTSWHFAPSYVSGRLLRIRTFSYGVMMPFPQLRSLFIVDIYQPLLHVRVYSNFPSCPQNVFQSPHSALSFPPTRHCWFFFPLTSWASCLVECLTLGICYLILALFALFLCVCISYKPEVRAWAGLANHGPASCFCKESFIETGQAHWFTNYLWLLLPCGGRWPCWVAVTDRMAYRAWNI